MTSDNNCEAEKTRLSDVSWLFLVMASCFGREWAKRYPPKKTRVMKNAKQEWGRIIQGYNRDELRCAIDQARKASDLPPSTTDFWKMLESRRIRDRHITQRQTQKSPPDKGLGAEMLKATKAFLANPKTENVRGD